MGRGLVVTTRKATQYPVATMFSVLLLAVGVTLLVVTSGFGLFNSANNGGFSVEVPPSDITSGMPSSAPSQASTQFLAGLYYLDSQRMWDSFSDRYKQSLTSKNISVGTMQSLIQSRLNQLQSQASPLKYVKIRMDSGGAVTNDIWVESYTGVFRLGDHLSTSSIELILDKNKKIDAVQTPSDSPDPILEVIFSNKPNTAAASSNSTAAPDSAATPKSEAGQYDSNPQPIKATEDFMTGATNFDGSKIWDSFSADFQKTLQDNKITPETIQTFLDQTQSKYRTQNKPLLYQGYTLLSELKLTGNRTFSRYEAVLTYAGTAHDFTYGILTDANGKIASVQLEDPLLSQALGFSSQGGQ
jgi:hypothetical protein